MDLSQFGFIKQYKGTDLNKVSARNTPKECERVRISVKYDGGYVQVNVAEKVRAFTSGGKELVLPPKVKHSFRVLGDGRYECEFIVEDGRLGLASIANGRLTKKRTAFIKGLDCPFEDDEKLMVFHKMPYSVGGLYVPPPHLPPKDHPFVQVVRFQTVTYDRAINYHLRARLKEGMEGIMLWRSGFKYAIKGRSQLLLKAKAFEVIKLPILRTYEGTGKYEGMVGGIVCDTLGLCNHSELKVGSGLTDSQRASGSLVGKTAVIRYFAMSASTLLRATVDSIE